MDNDIKHVHVGQAIDKRRNELGLSKSELGRKIGVPQQHIKPHTGKGDNGDKQAY